MSGAPLSVYLASSGGADLLPGRIEKALRGIGLEADVTYGGYGQWQQNLLTGANRGADLTLALLEGDDLFAPLLELLLATDPDELERATETLSEERIREVESAVEKALENEDGLLALTTCILPTSAELGGLVSHSFRALHEAVASFNRSVRQWADDSSRILVLDLEEVYLEHGRQQLHDPRLFNLARCRFSQQGLDLIAEHLARLWQAAHGKAHKCLVLDLDDTLWGGVLGEEGRQGIQIAHEGPGLAYRLFQQKIQHLERTGTLLAILSKNDEEPVWRVFEQHDAMVLEKKHFAAWRIDWKDKAENLRAIAQELNLGLDSLVFVDDNEAEREWIKSALPEVTVPDFPTDSALLPRFAELLGSRYFNRLRLSIEDLEKTEQYRAQGERARHATSQSSVEDFLASLEMRAEIREATRDECQRVSQLTQKTNQFNTTSRRYTQTEIESRIASDDWLVLLARLGDRFGDSGVVAVAMASRGPDPRIWTVDTFLMSCRVVGRTLEQSLFHSLAQETKRRGGETLKAEYIATGRNSLVADLWHELGLLPDPEDDRWRHDLSKPTTPSPYVSLAPEIDSPGIDHD